MSSKSKYCKPIEVDVVSVEYDVVAAMDQMKLGITMLDAWGRKWRYHEKTKVYLRRCPENKVWVINNPMNHGMYRWTQARGLDPGELMR